jgi:hypothetical protein
LQKLSGAQASCREEKFGIRPFADLKAEAVAPEIRPNRRSVTDGDFSHAILIQVARVDLYQGLTMHQSPALFAEGASPVLLH